MHTLRMQTHIAGTTCETEHPGVTNVQMKQRVPDVRETCDSCFGNILAATQIQHQKAPPGLAPALTP